MKILIQVIGTEEVVYDTSTNLKTLTLNTMSMWEAREYVHLGLSAVLRKKGYKECPSCGEWYLKGAFKKEKGLLLCLQCIDDLRMEANFALKGNSYGKN